MSDFSAPDGPSLGEMIVANSKPAPPPPVVEPPPPEIPGNANEATARLNALKADPKWTQEFLGGTPRHAKEFSALMDVISKGDNPAVDRAIAGVLYDGPFQPAGHMLNIAAAEMFRDVGIGDDVIRQTLTDYEVTPRKSSWRKTARRSACEITIGSRNTWPATANSGGK